MPTLFDAERMTLAEALELTAESLREYGPHYPHWAIAFSGGKDSSASTTAVLHLVESGRIPRPQSITVLFADTRMELPPLQAAALRTLDVVRSKGFNAEVVLPDLDERYFVYMLGRGVPPPTNTFRWCTPQIKVEPMLRRLQDLRAASGTKLLMLTGVRLGESAVRDRRISLSCSKDGGECGQGWFQLSTPEAVADTLAPCLHWRICHVWDWLAVNAPRDGYETRTVAQVYEAEGDEGEPNEVSARTGCVGCNLASQDFSLQRVLRRPEWSYLQPLRRLKPLYGSLRGHDKRLRKLPGERRKDGSLSAKQGRIGPLTIEARLDALEEVLSVQREVNAAANAQGLPEYSLINAEEEARIRELIAANTWPDKWTGEEPVADSLPYDVCRDGSIQPHLFGLEE